MNQPRRRVLHIEDNPDDLLLVQAWLPAERYEVLGAHDAEAARAQLAHERFDLVLLDHGLPDSNSLLLLEEIRCAHPRLPVFVLSGRSDDALALAARDKGAVRFLPKEAIGPGLSDELERSGPLHDAGEPLVYRRLLATMDTGCLLVDEEGVVTFANAAAGRLCGAAPAAVLLGRTVWELFDDTARAPLERFHRELQRRGAPQALEQEAALAGGTPVLLRARSMVHELGRHEACLVLLTDISELVRARRRQRERLLQLERMQRLLIGREQRVIAIKTRLAEYERRLGLPSAGVSEQTLRELALRLGGLAEEARPRPAGHDAVREVLLSLLEDLDTSRRQQERLRELDRLKSEFLANVSHELRTPITAIKGTVENLLDGLLGALSAEQLHAIELALRNARRLARLIDNLLDLSRLECGALDHQPRCIDLARSAREAAGDLAPLARRHGIELECQTGAEPLLVTADPERTAQVVQNLLDNALRFARGRVRLRVARDNGRTLLSVEDDGPGIPPPELERIFERFARASAPGRSQTGLGLSIVRGIVEASGGRVWAENRPAAEGGGARFVVTLPTAGAKEPPR